MTTTEGMRVGGLLLRAFAFALEAHDGQVRKGTSAPYFSHPMQVAGIAMEHGADEEQAAAALLHDVLEDSATTHQDLESRFGARVAGIVRDCSDTEDHEDKGEWKPRKRSYLAHLSTVAADTALVSCADKLHNARSIVADLRTHGPAFLDKKFRGKREGTLWYYRKLVEVFEGLDVPEPLRSELRLAVESMHALVGDAS